MTPYAGPVFPRFNRAEEGAKHDRQHENPAHRRRRVCRPRLPEASRLRRFAGERDVKRIP